MNYKKSRLTSGTKAGKVYSLEHGMYIVKNATFLTISGFSKKNFSGNAKVLSTYGGLFIEADKAMVKTEETHEIRGFQWVQLITSETNIDQLLDKGLFKLK